MICLEKLFANILSMSTIASLIFVLIMCIRQILKKKISFSKLNLLWIVFICILIIPIRFSSPLSIKNFLPAEKEFVFINVENAISLEDTKTENEGQINIIHIFLIYGFIWLIIMILLIFKDICVYLRFLKASSENISKVSSDVYEIFESCKLQLNIKTNISFVLQEQIKTPSLYGIFNPQILVTKDVVSLSADELECIFIHELNHYKSKHHYVYMILLLLKRIYWFNPIIYFADKIIKQDLEYMIDEQVLDILKNEKIYFKTILKILAMNSGLLSSIPNICSGKIEVERRIRQMKNKKDNTLFSRIIVSIVIIALSLITISLASEKTYTSDELLSEELIIENNVSQGKMEVVKPLANAIVTATFGERANPITGQKIVHTGIDVTSNETDEIVSLADGKVIFVGFDNERGNNIKIKHLDGSVSAYSHGKEILVKEGDEVHAGEKIMIMGATGMATGKHLHFELINSDGEYVDVNQIF